MPAPTQSEESFELHAAAGDLPATEHLVAFTTVAAPAAATPAAAAPSPTPAAVTVSETSIHVDRAPPAAPAKDALGLAAVPEQAQAAAPDASAAPRTLLFQCVVPPNHPEGHLLSWLSPSGARLLLEVAAEAASGDEKCVVEFDCPLELLNGDGALAEPTVVAARPAKNVLRRTASGFAKSLSFGSSYVRSAVSFDRRGGKKPQHARAQTTPATVPEEGGAARPRSDSAKKRVDAAVDAHAKAIVAAVAAKKAASSTEKPASAKPAKAAAASAGQVQVSIARAAGEVFTVSLERGVGGLGLNVEELKGATVGKVDPGSAADKGGIKPGDIIQRVNGGADFQSYDDVIQHLRRGGESVELSILSDGAAREVTLARGAGGLGLTVEEPMGVGIRSVDANSVAWRDGRIKAGDTIQAVDGADCFGYDGFVKRIRSAGKTVKLRVLSGPGAANVAAGPGAVIATATPGSAAAAAESKSEADEDTQQLTIEVKKLADVGLGATLVSPRTHDPAMVEEIEPGGVAARAGLLDGDRVVAVNGEVVADNEDAARKIGAAGEVVQLSITRRNSSASNVRFAEEAPTKVSYAAVTSASILKGSQSDGALPMRKKAEAGETATAVEDDEDDEEVPVAENSLGSARNSLWVAHKRAGDDEEAWDGDGDEEGAGNVRFAPEVQTVSAAAPPAGEGAAAEEEMVHGGDDDDDDDDVPVSPFGSARNSLYVAHERAGDGADDDEDEEQLDRATDELAKAGFAAPPAAAPEPEPEPEPAPAAPPAAAPALEPEESSETLAGKKKGKNKRKKKKGQ